MDGAALDTLRQVLAESRIELPAALPPMSAGIFGYMGYDTIRLIEALPNENPDHLGVPDSILIRPTVIVIFDTVKDEMIIVTPVYPGTKTAANVSTSTHQGSLCFTFSHQSHEGSFFIELRPGRCSPLAW